MRFIKTAGCVLICFRIIFFFDCSAFSEILPANLCCESKPNPLGLSETSPRLSWQDVDTISSERGQFQTAYRIQVASSLQTLTNNQGDLWDTGEVVTNQTAQVAYTGSALVSQQVCYWHVQLWDKNGQSSGWSTPATWTMGIINQSEWTAQWIGRDDAPAWNTGSSFFNANWIWFPEGYPTTSAPVATRWFRKTFTVPDGVSIAEAVATMTGDNMFTLYVNGQVALSEEDPMYWQHYAQADISQFLVPGTNFIAVSVVNTGTAPNPAGLIGSFDLTYSNGQTNSFQTDGSWLAANQLFSNWNQTNFIATGWSNAMVLGAYGIGPWGNFAKTYLAATMVRKDFAISQLPSRAVLYVTGQGLIEPHLNGAKVGSDYFLPGWTDYHLRLYYQAYDVTSLLQPGSNTVGAILGDGWYRGNCAFDGQDYYGTKTRLLAQLYLFYTNAPTQIVGSDATWQAGFGPILQGDNQAGETYDAQLELPGWDSAGYTNSSWINVTTGAEISPVIQANPQETIQTNQSFSPLSITQPQPGLCVLNFGQNISGWASLQVSNQPAGRRIVMRFGERLNPDGTVFRDNLTTALAMDTYICKGGAVETWEPRFTYHGFQYLEVQGLAQPPGTNTITAVSVRTHLSDAGSFQCSSGLINQIFSNMLWSVRDNYFAVPTDCPQRAERAGWCDGIEIMGTGMFNMQAESYFEKWAQDIVDTRARATESDFGHQAPLVSDDGFAAGWQDSVVFVPYYIYQTYGDLRPAQRFYTNMVYHLNYYAANSTGFIGPNEGYGDWVGIDSSTPLTLISTAFYARCANMMSQMAQALGKPSDAAADSLLFTNICAAFQTNFVTSDGTVGSGSQGGYALALAFNLLTPAQVALAKNKLAGAVSAAGGNPTTGMVTTHLLLPALTSIGRSDLAYQMLAKTNYPSLGFEIGLGATTIFELWNGVNANGTVNTNQDGMNSLNHANFGACAEWFYRDILGIDSLAPGFSKIQIDPQMGGGLTWAQGSYNSIQGSIASSWQLTNNLLTLNVRIPVNTSADIFVPTTNAEAITESGVSAVISPGVTYIGISNGAAIYNVGSGNYTFSSPFSASATPISVNNYSFESDVAPVGGLVATVPSGWTAFNEGGASDIGSQSGGGTDYTAYDPLAPPASGNQYCYINMFDSGVTGGIYQDVGILQPNTTYTLAVAIGSRADRINSPGIISLVNGTDNTGTVLATGGGLPNTQNTWQDYTVTFTTGPAVCGDLTIVLSAAGTSSTIQADFDNVQLTSAPVGVTLPTVNNYSFEANIAPVGGDATTVPTGWLAFNEAGASDIGSENSGGAQYTINNPLAAPANGNQYCYINMFNPSVTGGIYQDVGALQPNTTYALTVAIGSRADRINSPGIISLVNGTDNTGTVLATGGGLPNTQNTWQNYTVTYTTGATVSGDLTVVLSVLGNATTIQSDFDNVRLTVTPETLVAPALRTLRLSGGNLILTGVGGAPNGEYTLLTTTNLLPPVIWSTNLSGTLDDTGAFSNSVSLGTNPPVRYFELKIP
jgi:alpha-L-rhamnosidase